MANGCRTTGRKLVQAVTEEKNVYSGGGSGPDCRSLYFYEFKGAVLFHRYI